MDASVTQKARGGKGKNVDAALLPMNGGQSRAVRFHPFAKKARMEYPHWWKVKGTPPAVLASAQNRGPRGQVLVRGVEMRLSPSYKYELHPISENPEMGHQSFWDGQTWAAAPTPYGTLIHVE
jgi:hypothetical protein